MTVSYYKRPVVSVAIRKEFHFLVLTSSGQAEKLRENDKVGQYQVQSTLTLIVMARLMILFFLSIALCHFAFFL